MQAKNAIYLAATLTGQNILFHGAYPKLAQMCHFRDAFHKRSKIFHLYGPFPKMVKNLLGLSDRVKFSN